MHECMVRLCILLNSLLYICKSELRKSQSGIKGFFFATAAAGMAMAGGLARHTFRSFFSSGEIRIAVLPPQTEVLLPQ